MTKEKEKNQVALISVLAAIFLTTFKATIGILTGSLGIKAEALHSSLDLVAAVVTLFAIRISSKPSDSDHHYGHGKVENFSALIETFLLLATCVWIVYEAIHRLTLGGDALIIKVNPFSYIVIITSITIDIWRSRKLSRVAKKHKSQALEADALHFSTDIWSSAVVLIGLVCVSIGKWTGITAFYYADSIAALMVAVLVIYVSWSLGMRAVNALLDKAPVKESKDIEKIIKHFPDVIEYHDLRIRQSGHQLMIDATIHVDGSLTLVDAHDISENLEKKIIEYDQFSIVTIHVEPNNH